MDRRAIKTKKAIREAFLTLLKDRNINRITVAEISRRADLGRGTFYLHYRDVYDLYNQIENDLYTDLEKIFDRSYPSSDHTNLRYLINTITEYIESNRNIFLLLSRPDSCGKVMHKLKIMFYKKVLLEEPDLDILDYDVVESMFIVSGVIGVLEEWLSEELKLPQKKIAEMLHKIVVRIGVSDVY